MLTTLRYNTRPNHRGITAIDNFPSKPWGLQFISINRKAVQKFGWDFSRYVSVNNRIWWARRLFQITKKAKHTNFAVKSSSVGKKLSGMGQKEGILTFSFNKTSCLIAIGSFGAKRSTSQVALPDTSMRSTTTPWWHLELTASMYWGITRRSDKTNTSPPVWVQDTKAEDKGPNGWDRDVSHKVSTKPELCKRIPWSQ